MVFIPILISATLILAVSTAPTNARGPRGERVFHRVASFPVFLNTDIALETVAEIVAATPNGRTLVYTDAETKSVGFVDIRNPANPQPLGAIELNGEPTSVDIFAQFAFVAVNTSPDFVNPSGELVVIHIPSQRIRAEFPLAGQPDSIALSHNGKYAAIVIENERDEDLGNGEPPQQPGGFLTILDVRKGTFRNVDLTGIPDLFPEDPEPEYVDINKNDIAVVTLQENNHIVLVDLRDGEVVGDFNAGEVDLEEIDTIENDRIELDSSLQDVPREPDGVTWINESVVATADEGDLFGGSRGFTLFDTEGNILYEAGNTVEHLAARHGHYPEDRSENKGSEPEGIEFGAYRSGDFLFVGTERASLVLVYRLTGDGAVPEYVQALPGGVGPEGLLAIPRRNLFVTASENDDPGGIRSIITIYQLGAGPATYPSLLSQDAPAADAPIPWGALSALAADPDSGAVYTVRDSFYRNSSIYTVDASDTPALITAETILSDVNGALAAVAPDLVNPDGTVNLDPEGIAVRPGGGFWMASEGSGSVDDPSRPVTSPNLLLRVNADGEIEEVVPLPVSVNDRQRRFGFEGVTTAVTDEGEEVVLVAFQREWVDDPDDRVRIGRYEVGGGDWTFYYYPLEQPVADGWVGLSEIVALDEETFAVVERDNQADVYAAIKTVHRFSIAGLTPLPDQPGTPNFPVVQKTLVYDLLPDLKATGGAVIEKVEGLTVLGNGTALVVTDNDGVDGSNGETQFLRIEGLFAE
jgi:hypothetical protein